MREAETQLPEAGGPLPPSVAGSSPPPPLALMGSGPLPMPVAGSTPPPPPPHASTGVLLGGSLHPIALMASERKEGASGSRAKRDPSALKAIGQGQGRFTQWRVHFLAETDPGNWIEGLVRLSHHSRWMALFDLENDVLAGDYLPAVTRSR